MDNLGYSKLLLLWSCTHVSWAFWKHNHRSVFETFLWTMSLCLFPKKGSCVQWGPQGHAQLSVILSEHQITIIYSGPLWQNFQASWSPSFLLRKLVEKRPWPWSSFCSPSPSASCSNVPPARVWPQQYCSWQEVWVVVSSRLSMFTHQKCIRLFSDHLELEVAQARHYFC